MRKIIFLSLVGLVSAGCQSAHIPNPNDPADVGPLSPATVRRNLRAVTDNLNQRLVSGEIDQTKYDQLVEKAASEIAGDADSTSIPPAQAWEYGEVLRDAHQWKLAEPILRSAVDFAKKTHNEDRWVNDSLRLAVVQAHEGKVADGILTARSVFGAPPTETAPILLSVYMEFAPVASGKGHDLELARLVEDAIGVDLKTQVDPNSDAGKTFVAVRPIHVHRAWHLAETLYEAAGRHDLAAHARAQMLVRV